MIQTTEPRGLLLFQIGEAKIWALKVGPKESRVKLLRAFENSQHSNESFQEWRIE